MYSDFQDHLRKCYKNEKTLNSFLTGLPEFAQIIEPDELTRLIQKAETAYNELHEVYVQFVDVVKHECVMNVHFFLFTSIPDLIVRKNYTRKQYETITKLLVSVKNAFLEHRLKAEAEKNEEDDADNAHIPKKDMTVITEEDMIELSMLDDFLTQHQRSFEQKKALWNLFI